MSVGSALGEVLRGGRAEFNRRFVLAQQRWPALDPAAFSELLAGPVDGICDAVARVQPSALPATVDALYDTTLSLLGQRWIGPGGRAAAIVHGWSVLARQAPALLALQPAPLLTAVANAMVHWSAHGGGADWLATLAALAPRARSPEELLRAGQVAAWRHGLAHYRDSALERARTLERELLAIAFGVPIGDWQDTMLDRLRGDRWYRPDQPEPGRAARVIGRVGAFVGFGGRFAEPPLAALDGGDLILHANGQRFALHADAYGHSLQAHGEGALPAAIALPAGWRIEGAQLIGPGLRQAFLDQGAITSAAATADVLLLTHAWSHSATVLALPLP